MKNLLFGALLVIFAFQTSIAHSAEAGAQERPRLMLAGHQSNERILGLTPMRFGVRLALGATLGAIAGLVAGETVASALTGAAVIVAIDLVQITLEAGLVGQLPDGLSPQTAAARGANGKNSDVPILQLAKTSRIQDDL